VLQQVLQLCLNNGAVMAKPGEFTQRAFLNGKLDLTQAEAVADLIASESGAAHDAAMHNLRGGFSSELHQMREQLITFSALIELELDFSQEDVEFADRTKLYELLDGAITKITALVQSFHLGNAIKNGVRVAIIGKPNAGKSTLLNALLNEERAIVSEIAGTTRDTIEETLNINGILFRFIDTAGIREHATDAIEIIGIERSRKKAEEADIILYVSDITQDTHQQTVDAENWLESLNKPYLYLLNKIDDLPEPYIEVVKNPQFLSAKKGTGVAELKQELYDKILAGKIKQEGTIITNARHYAELQLVLASLHDIKAGMDSNISGDLLALDIRNCLYHLGSITGEVQQDRDILGAIFGKFCIGK
jgi:tRNA modification GTPase